MQNNEVNQVFKDNLLLLAAPLEGPTYFTGSPAGEDRLDNQTNFHVLWINKENEDIDILSTDKRKHLTQRIITKSCPRVPLVNK